MLGREVRPMTEAEWRSAPIADLLLHTLDIHRHRHGAEPTDTTRLQPPAAVLRCDLGRKHMLLAFAIVRRYWRQLVPAARRTITAWEAVEEGKQERDPLGDDYAEFTNTLITCERAAKGETALALWLVTGWWPGVKTEIVWEELPVDWRPLFDDIFGDAFRTVTFSPDWRTDTALSLARQMYKSRDFSAMPILADALQDAGCDSEPILSHCRGGGPHVRGCWVVDLVLGRA
jgi:hypothetical protein